MLLKFPMQKGHQYSEAIASVQRILNELGYYGFMDSANAIAADKGKPPEGALLIQIVDDGIFGPMTQAAVEAFQEDEGILVDGVVGEHTMEKLEEAWARRGKEMNTLAISSLFAEDADDSVLQRTMVPLRRVDTNTDARAEKLTAMEKKSFGYARFSIRSDVADAYEKVRNIICDLGGAMTSSGGIRALEATVSSSRSATSFHYVGRALDLAVASGMSNPAKDPFVVRHDPDNPGYWIVYARVKSKRGPAEQHSFTDLASYDRRFRTGGISQSGTFVNVTQVFKDHGFARIRHRNNFLNGGTWLGAEWWHFQYEDGLIPRVSTFGGELRRLYSPSQLETSSPWKFRDRIFKINWG